MERDVLLKLFRGLLAAKEAIDLNYVSSDAIIPCLDEFFQGIHGVEPKGLLEILIEKRHIAESEAEPLRQLHETKDVPAGFDIANPTDVERILGIDSAQKSQKQVQARCPHCQTIYCFKVPEKSTKFRCASCYHAFYITPAPGPEQIEVSKELPIPTDAEPIKPMQTVKLSSNQMDRLKKGIAQLRERQTAQKEKKGAPVLQKPVARPAQKAATPPPPRAVVQPPPSESQEEMKSLWSSDEEEFADANLQSLRSSEGENSSRPLWSSESADTETQESLPASLWSSDSLDAGPQETIPASPSSKSSGSHQAPVKQTKDDEPLLASSSGGVDYDLPKDNDLPKFDFSSVPKQDEEDQTASQMNTDSLKLPEEETVDSFDLLNISTTPTESEPATMELDIRTTPLFKEKSKRKEKPGGKTTKAFLKVVREIRPEESLVMVKYALNYDYISRDECKALLDIYFDALSAGEASENPASLLLLEGYITKFQYDTLLEALGKDRKAGRVPKDLDMTSRAAVEKYLGSSEESKLMRIICPYCKTTFRVRASLKGGKFRCGKCQKSFFLSKK